MTTFKFPILQNLDKEENLEQILREEKSNTAKNDTLSIFLFWFF